VMKVWPFGIALRGEVSNRLMLRWLMTVVVSDEEKAHGMRQVGIGKTSASDPLVKRRKNKDDIETGEYQGFRDEPGGRPYCWPGGVRRRGGVSPVCGICMERGKASGESPLPRVPGAWWGLGEAVGEGVHRRRKPEVLSTVATLAGGPARSSGEAPVMGVERRGRLIC
jgi:hypothetical protein